MTTIVNDKDDLTARLVATIGQTEQMQFVRAIQRDGNMAGELLCNQVREGRIDRAMAQKVSQCLAEHGLLPEEIVDQGGPEEYEQEQHALKYSRTPGRQYRTSNPQDRNRPNASEHRQQSLPRSTDPMRAGAATYQGEIDQDVEGIEDHYSGFQDRLEELTDNMHFGPDGTRVQHRREESLERDLQRNFEGHVKTRGVGPQPVLTDDVRQMIEAGAAEVRGGKLILGPREAVKTPQQMWEMLDASGALSTGKPEEYNPSNITDAYGSLAADARRRQRRDYPVRYSRSQAAP